MRRALIRLLGGTIETSSSGGRPAPAPLAAPFGMPAPATPAQGSSQLLQQAERCFAYAELLSQQGAVDLAAPIYRQAYMGLRTLCGIAGVPAPVPQAALPPARTQAPAPQPPAAAVSSLEQQLRPLREGLSTNTAADVERRLMALIQQGQRHADITNLMGLALLLQERRGEAERWFRETLQIHPRHTRALVNLGGLCLTTERPQEAVQFLSQAIEGIDPRSSDALAALTNLALAHQQLGRPMEAAQLALRIFRLQPNHLRPESLAAAATTLEEMGEEEAAIEMLRHLRTRGAGPDLIRRLAQLLERRGDFQEAAMVYRDLLATPEASPTS
ncbi:MAG: tetratricopeptide repeat protein [Cyanobacteriota bacterium]